MTSTSAASFVTGPTEGGRVGAVRGTALFVAAIVGPGILTLPALAAAQAGPASLVTLAALLAVSAPVAFTFVALQRAVPGAHGVAGYAAAAFGPLVGRYVAAWFRYGVPVGIPALGLIGGEYVAEATGTGEATAVAVAAAACLVAIVSSVRHGSGDGVLTLALSALLVGLVVATAVVALPHADARNLTPFAPHGYAAMLSCALVLTWVLTGWEAVTNFTRVLDAPRRTLPRVTTATLLVVALLYTAVAVPQIAVLGTGAGDTGAPVAALLRVAVGPTGAIIAALVAVVIATGNTVAWVGSVAELNGSDQPRARAEALVVPVLIIVAGLAAVGATSLSTTQLVSICAGSQVPVYVIGLAAGVKLLPARSRSWWLAVVATAAVSTLLVPAGVYLTAPVAIAACVTARHVVRSRADLRADTRRRGRRAGQGSLGRLGVADADRD